MLKSAILAMFEFRYAEFSCLAGLSLATLDLFLVNYNLVHSKPVELSVIELC